MAFEDTDLKEIRKWEVLDLVGRVYDLWDSFLRKQAQVFLGGLNSMRLRRLIYRSK
jgi:hypothetical protein